MMASSSGTIQAAEANGFVGAPLPPAHYEWRTRDWASRTSRLGMAWAVVLVGVLLILVVLPLVTVFFGAFWSQSPIMPGGELTLGNWGEVLTSNSFQKGVRTSLVIGVFVTLICTLVASLLAFAVVRTNIYFGGVIEGAIYINLATSPFVLALSWIALATPRVGLLNRLPGLDELNISTIPGIVFVMVTFFVPWFYLMVKPSIATMDSRLEEAAAVHGAHSSRMIRDVTLPLIRPALLGAVLLIFVLAVDTFSIPALLGAPSGITVLPYQMYSYIYSFPAAWEKSAVVGIVLLVFAVVLLLVRDRVVGDVRRYRVVAGKGGVAKTIQFSPALRHAFSWLGLTYVLVATVLPALGLLAGAFLKYATGHGITIEALTLQNFAVLQTAGFQTSLWTTVVVMTLASVFDVALCMAVTILVFHTRIPVLSTAADLLVRMPVGIPGVVLGAGLLWAYVRVPFPIYGTALILLLALSTRYLAQTFNTVSSAYLQISPELREAALVCGAKSLRIVRDIDLPLMYRALGTSLLLTMILVGGEVNSSVMVSSPNASTLPIFLFQILSGSGNPQYAYVVALAQIALVAIVGGAAYLVGRVFIRQIAQRAPGN